MIKTHFLFFLFFFLLQDLDYLTTALQVGKTELEAAEHFLRLIRESSENVRARLNFAVHILANPG